MSFWRQDLAYTLRRLSKLPGFVLAVVVSIGLGIAANATIFSMVSRFVLRPAPVGNPGTLMALHTTAARRMLQSISPGRSSLTCASKPNRFPAWQAITTFSRLHRRQGRAGTRLGPSGHRQLLRCGATTAWRWAAVSRATKSVCPLLSSATRLWQRRFAADPAILGKSVTLSGRPFHCGWRGAAAISRPRPCPLTLQFWVPLGNIDAAAAQYQRFPVAREPLADGWWGASGPASRPPKPRLNSRCSPSASPRPIPETEKDGGFRFEPAGSLPPRDQGRA